MDPQTKRMIVNILDKCRVRSTALFKVMKGSDPPDPTTGRQSSYIPAQQFELCIRSVGITAPRAVFNVLLEMVGVNQDGNVNYAQFLEDLGVEENLKADQIATRRMSLKA